MRIDDGAVTEYVQFGSSLGNLDALARALMSPAYATNDFAAPPAVPVNAELRAITPAIAPNVFAGTLTVAASAGSDLITVDAAPPTTAFAVGDLLQIGATASAYREIVTVTEVPADPADLTLRISSRLARDHAAGQAVTRVTAGAASNARTLAASTRATGWHSSAVSRSPPTRSWPSCTTASAPTRWWATRQPSGCVSR